MSQNLVRRKKSMRMISLVEISFRLLAAAFLATVFPTSLSAQETVTLPPHAQQFRLYPFTYQNPPAVGSPATSSDGIEVLVAFTRDGKFAVIPVTVENGRPLHYSRRIESFYGKDQQLQVDSGDFPSLAERGLHSELELEKKEMITGVPVDVITYIGRPGRFSLAGFIAEDEDIVSVLKGDNILVKRMGLTHPQMARPLFHVWNILLKEIDLGKLRRFSSVQYFLYRGRKVYLDAEGTKGWQISIFQDEIQGRFNIKILRSPTPEEKRYLETKYSHLSSEQTADLEEKLSCIRFSEMAPYYIMRYGFYEGHCSYRTDPIAIAFIFGLKSLEELDRAMGEDLYSALTDHFVPF
jgi:hypothetical protein